MKKFLSLVLALVMTMSLVTVSAGAKDFADDSKIAYKEAVDVMSAVKVIDGYADGSFNPSATLTRGAAAKIICNLILGPTTANALAADAAPYKDVPVNHTFAGYIAYCQKTGIISGYADGTFKPANTLTGYAFMKMLLGALGYKAENEGYTGSNWSINVAKRAINIGLNDDLNGSFNGVKAVTREEACLYAFNTLKATMVEYDKNSTVTVGNITIKDTSDAKEKTCVKGSGNDGNIAKDGKVQFAEEYFGDLKGKPATDAFERPATQWKVKSTDVGTYAKTPDLTYTEEVKGKTIYADLGLTDGIAAKDVTNYVDGDKKASDKDILKGDKDTVWGGNGALTEVFYDDDAETVIITVVNTYLAKIQNAYKATSTKDAYVTVDAKTAPAAGISKTSYETDAAFSADDYVLYTYSFKTGDVGIQSMAAAESVSGTLTAYTGKKDVTVDGTQYKSNCVQASKDTIDSLQNAVKTEVTVYLDGYGYAIYVDADAASDNYAVVLGYTGVGSVGTNIVRNVTLLFADGTTKTVTADTDHSDAFVGDVASAAGINVYDIVSYRVNSDGEYKLSVLSDTYKLENNTASATKIVEKHSQETATLKNGRYNSQTDVTKANSKTVVLVKNGTTYTSYTGIANIPTVTLKAGKEAWTTTYAKSSTAPAKLIFIEQNANTNVNSNSKDVVFIKGSSTAASYNSDLGDYYTYDAVVNGKITKIYTDFQVTTNSLYADLSKSSKDVYSVQAGTTISVANTDSATNVNDGSNKLFAGVGTDKASNGSIELGNKTVSVADDCKVFFVSADGDTISESSVSAIGKDFNDKVLYKVTDSEVTTIVITILDETVTPPAGSTTYTATLSNNSGTLQVAIAGGAGSEAYKVEKVIVTNLNNGVSTEITPATAITGTLTNGSVGAQSITGITVTNTGLTTYQVVLTVGGETVTSNKVMA